MLLLVDRSDTLTSLRFETHRSHYVREGDPPHTPKWVQFGRRFLRKSECYREWSHDSAASLRFHKFASMVPLEYARIRWEVTGPPTPYSRRRSLVLSVSILSEQNANEGDIPRVRRHVECENGVTKKKEKPA